MWVSQSWRRMWIPKVLKLFGDNEGGEIKKKTKEKFF